MGDQSHLRGGGSAAGIKEGELQHAGSLGQKGCKLAAGAAERGWRIRRDHTVLLRCKELCRSWRLNGEPDFLGASGTACSARGIPGRRKHRPRSVVSGADIQGGRRICGPLGSGHRTQGPTLSAVSELRQKLPSAGAVKIFENKFMKIITVSLSAGAWRSSK